MINQIIDISNNNLITNYNEFKNYAGVILKASEGTTYTDAMLETNYKNLIGKTNIGFYHFARSTSSPTTQAEHFWELIKDKQFQIKPVLDIEDTNIEDANSFIYEFRKRFKELSNETPLMLYSYTNYIETKIKPKVYECFSIWEANYGGQPKFNPTLHQYTETAKLNCTQSNTDLSNIKSNDYLITQSTIITQNKTSFDNEIIRLQTEINKQGFGNIAIDGIIGAETRKALPTLKKGAIGEITKWLQLRLGVSADGVFGNETQQAVKWFQRTNGLTDDGIVGAVTWYYITKQYCKGVNWSE